ncbi:hypothetical protein AKJ09_00507 [Labilithrix luteola]|uniref:Tryptophan synthase alpha chain n=1 Tax=Labilithrix luteola TaxID=1391654 RepID=A0A0K1PJX6_9BACT|nr:hypothetical protein [Labilithrix luteola]AKU93843.1 hypothetical protein AKJ09_00507 [Labilithrix luteola]
MRASVIVVSVVAASILLVGGCSTTEERLGTQPPATGPSFIEQDAAAEAEASAPADTLVSYCPSNQCPTGWTNCPNSEFPCDVNLLTDRNNCGACGVVCPELTFRERYECVDGQCVMSCRVSPLTLDCDGIPDNGCEASPLSNDHCGSCAVKCTDPDKPCVDPGWKGIYSCGCPDGQLKCGDSCIDPSNDDSNCGACGVECDWAGGKGDLDPNLNAYYGCVAAKCDQLKCYPGWDNCDGDETNGCETPTTTNDNCQTCGHKCDSGTQCRSSVSNNLSMCMCGTGKSFCPLDVTCTGPNCSGDCYDFSTDPKNCGACGVACGSRDSTIIGMCVNGNCRAKCVDGRADCNGNEQADGCEVDTNSDPRNCGGCGIVCNAVAGQACVGGRCVVEPCPAPDAGSGPQ